MHAKGTDKPEPGGEDVRAARAAVVDGRSNRLGLPMTRKPEPIGVLAGIKLLHTVVWCFFAGCIVSIPVAGALRQFRWAAILSGVVAVECAVLAANRMRCPLTDLAGRYTEERADNFDIYLPLWLARHNKQIFGTLYVLGGAFALGLWTIR